MVLTVLSLDDPYADSRNNQSDVQHLNKTVKRHAPSKSLRSSSGPSRGLKSEHRWCDQFLFTSSGILLVATPIVLVTLCHEAKAASGLSRPTCSATAI